MLRLLIKGLAMTKPTTKKGRPKGFIPKPANCGQCGREVAPNMKVCPYCLKLTGLVSTAKELKK
ncbi:hypothetical protein ORF038 [Pseudomonas phage 73]|uniref:hypothetical protein ORF038 n=1 Tax=Pseudomonas phage 73 TaxID=347325 RepID=UPI0001545E8E|nr:hypothetical protein ORF038 [Pseudomonas phage 73]